MKRPGVLHHSLELEENLTRALVSPMSQRCYETRGSWTVFRDVLEIVILKALRWCWFSALGALSAYVLLQYFWLFSYMLTLAHLPLLIVSMGLGTVLPLSSFENVLLFLFSILLATAIIFLNVSVFISILINRSLRSENRFMYMLSTCFSDICSGVSYYYCGALDVRDSYDSPTRTFYIAPTFLGLSYMAILAAQADRYHAVTAPFKYSQRMTRNRTIMVIVGYWIYAFVIVAVNNLVTVGIAKTVTGIGTFVGNIFTVIIMIGLNIRLFLIAKYQLEREPPSAERENKRASIYLIVVVAVCFLIAWLPIFLHIIVCNFLGTTCYAFRNEGTDPLRILPRINAALTPILYIRGCGALRTTLLAKVWTTCSKRTRVIPASEDNPPNVHPVSVIFKK